MSILPTKKNIPSTNIQDYVLLISGEKKVGKTSFCTHFPDHFIMEFECGNARHLEARYLDIDCSNTFTKVLNELEKNPKYCKTLIVDEVVLLYRMIWADLCKREGINDPGELSFGKGWSRIGSEFDNYIKRICALKCGVIFTAHTEMKEVELRSGRKVSKLEANLTSRVNRTMEQYVHLWGTMVFGENRRRELHLIGDEMIKASHGFKDNFKTLTEGFIDLGNSAEEGYRNFINAWNNSSTDKVQPTITEATQQVNRTFKRKMKRKNG